MKLTKQEMMNLYGGAISGTLINAFVRGINALLELGRSIGTAIRRVSGNNICQLS